MIKPILAVTLLLAASPAVAQTCLHGPNESSQNKTRREQALQLAMKINIAQNPSGPGRRYRPLSELLVPLTPPGFTLQFHVNANGYAFSLKDSLDSCGYAIFSDQEGAIYEAVPRKGGMVLPAAEGTASTLSLRSRSATQLGTLSPRPDVPRDR
jgi:hypothetical protein